MFLKRLCLALLVANVGYFVYSQGWLGSLLGGDSAQREPQRLAKQINPDALGVSFAPSAAQEILPPAVAPLASLASSAISCNPSATATEQWRVYMGPYANKELLEKKKAELARLGVVSSEVSKTSLPRGLALGRPEPYTSEAQARIVWASLQKQGIKTATVLLWSAPSKDKAC